MMTDYEPLILLLAVAGAAAAYFLYTVSAFSSVDDDILTHLYVNNTFQGPSQSVRLSM
jgi:hypothetical protein